MLNKKIAIITLAAVISNFSFTTTNVLADEITKNVKIVAQTKNNQNLKTKKSNKSKNESKLSESKSNESNSERTFTLAQNGNISWKARNDLRMTYFGTDSWAAPVLGIIATVIMFGGGMAWLSYRTNKAKKAGEGYGNYQDKIVSDNKEVPGIGLAFAPILIILVVNLVLSKMVYPNVDGSYLEESFNSTLAANSGTWSVLLGMLVAILFIAAVNFSKLKDGLKDSLKKAANESLAPLINSCAVVGFGSVTKSLAIFGIIQAFALGISSNALLSEVLSINILCGMTASASGGLGAALEALADTYLASGIAPQVLHRVAAVAAGGLDSLPYNGATITVLALVGMTHKESYLDMFVVSVVIPLIAAFALAALASMGICF